MHPITIIEILIAVGVVLGLLMLVFVLPKKFRRISLLLVLFLSSVEIAFFVVRPLWIDYHVTIKIEQLDEFLEKKYPDEEWKISRRTSRNYNPYHLEVRFENEKEWIYGYSVNSDEIKQVSVGVPDEQYYKDGRHYEGLGE